MAERFPLSLTIPAAIIGSYFMYSLLKALEISKRIDLAKHIVNQCPEARLEKPCTANCIGLASGLCLNINTQYINWPQNIRLIDSNHDNNPKEKEDEK